MPPFVGTRDPITEDGLNQLSSVAGAFTVAGALNVSGALASLNGQALPLAAYTQAYASADRTLGAYTPDAESGAYTGDGGGIGGVSAAANLAKLADLNALRAAVENLRSFTEDLAAVVNSHTDDLQSLGIVG